MSFSLAKPASLSWDRYSQTPFVRLVRLFVGRIFHGSGDSADGELDLTTGLVLSLLALPGGFYSILLAEKYSTLLLWLRHQSSFDPLAGALPDEYFFIVLSMTVTGIVAVWRWESIFPDRRDFANLAALPLSMRQLFLANVAAIAFLAAILALDVNAASAVLFPLVVSASVENFSFFAQFVWVHAFVVVLASVFSFFAVLATVGALMVMLPYAVFRWISLYVRGVLIACLIAMLSTSFAVPSMLGRLPSSWLKILPPVWFLGLCQLLRGRATESLAMLGHVALIGSVAIVASAAASYALSYRRCFVKIPQTVEWAPALGEGRLPSLMPVMDRMLLRTPFERAGYRFALKTLFCNESHGLVLGGFLGFGIVLACQFLFVSFNAERAASESLPSSEILAIPLILSYCIVLGLRFVFEIPAEMQANWIFRMHVDRANHEALTLGRKLILTFVLPWTVALVLPIYWYLWDWRVGAVEACVVALWAYVLTDIVLHRFRKMPFTSTYPPFRDSAGVLAIVYTLGVFVYVVLTANLVRVGLSNLIVIVVLFAVALITVLILRRARSRAEPIDTDLIFEEQPPAAFELLDLSRTR